MSDMDFIDSLECLSDQLKKKDADIETLENRLINQAVQLVELRTMLQQLVNAVQQGRPVVKQGVRMYNMDVSLGALKYMIHTLERVE